jgi:hypothetical protein
MKSCCVVDARQHRIRQPSIFGRHVRAMARPANPCQKGAMDESWNTIADLGKLFLACVGTLLPFLKSQCSCEVSLFSDFN